MRIARWRRARLHRVAIKRSLGRSGGCLYGRLFVRTAVPMGSINLDRPERNSVVERDSMPATSQAQQRFMAIAEHQPSKLRGKTPDMSKSKMHDFTTAPSKNLPAKAPKHGLARLMK